MAKLLSELERVGAVSPDSRRATFRTVAFVAYPDGDDVWAEGEVAGVISAAPAGEAGFGYDPVFAPEGLGGRTFAQMSPDGEARHLPPRAGLPGARRAPVRRIGIPVTAPRHG